MPAILQSLNLTWVDMVALVFILLTGVHGLVRKLSGELAHVLGFLAALFVGRWAYAQAPHWEWLKSIDREGRGGPALVFICAVLAALLCMIALSWVLRKIMTVAFEPRIDRLFGLFAGLFRGAIIVMLIFLAMNALPFKPLNDVFGDSTRIGKLVIDVTPTLRNFYRRHLAADEKATEPPADPASETVPEEQAQPIVTEPLPSLPDAAPAVSQPAPDEPQPQPEAAAPPLEP